MARPLVHRMIRKGDRAVVFWSIYHRVLVKGRANTVHIRAMEVLGGVNRSARPSNRSEARDCLLTSRR
jgi:hypothetical protein